MISSNWIKKRTYDFISFKKMLLSFKFNEQMPITKLCTLGCEQILCKPLKIGEKLTEVAFM